MIYGRIDRVTVPTMWAHMDPEKRDFCSLSEVSFTILEYTAEGDMMHTCIRCGTLLVVGENITQYDIDHSKYICRSCTSKYKCDYNRRTGISLPMNENKECGAFLGVHVSERVLSHVFKHVERMPHNNRGYDFICGRGYKIDVKSSCRHHRSGNAADSWGFVIRRNQIAGYFLCLAFDNRESLNPEHIWLIPAGDINNHVMISVADTQVCKWRKYELPINKVMSCCNEMR